MALCTWQQERDALHTLTLTDFEKTLSEEPSLALDNLRSEGGAWLGWEAIAQKGPLHREELGHLLETVSQRKPADRAVQFARVLRDTSTQELVASLETFLTTGSREPDLAEELDRADEAAEAEADEEIP